MCSVAIDGLRQAPWWGGTGGYAQQLGQAANFLSCLARAIEWAPRPVRGFGWKPKPGRLLNELPGQLGPPSWLCKWADGLTVISS